MVQSTSRPGPISSASPLPAPASSRPAAPPSAAVPDAPSGAHVAPPRGDATRPAPLPASSGALALGLHAPGDLVDSGAIGTIRFTPSDSTRKPVVQRYLQDPAFQQLGFDLRKEGGGVDLDEANTTKLLGAPIVAQDFKAFVTDIMLGTSGLQFRARSPEGFMRALGKGGIGRDVVDLLLAKLAAPAMHPALLGAYSEGRATIASAPLPESPGVVALKPLADVPAVVSPKMVDALNRVTDRLVAAMGTGDQNVAFSLPAMVASLNQLLVGATPDTVEAAVLAPLGLAGQLTPAAFVRELQSAQAYLANLPGVKTATALFTKADLTPAFQASVEQGLGSAVASLAGRGLAAATQAVNAAIEQRTEVKDASGKVLIPGMTDLVSEQMVQNSEVLSIAALTTQGEWVKKFTKTAPATFTGPKGAAPVTLMTDQRNVKVAQLPGAHVVRLPLASGLEYEFAVPTGPSAEVRAAALPALVKTRSPEAYEFVDRAVRLAIPRSKVTQGFDPLAALRLAGIEPEALNLAGVVGDPSLKLTEGAARTTSLRNESGGSTSSAVAMGATRSASLPLAITADVPHTVKLRAPNGLVLVAEVIADGKDLDPGPG